MNEMFFTRIQNSCKKIAFVCTNVLEHCIIYQLMLHRILEDEQDIRVLTQVQSYLELCQ